MKEKYLYPTIFGIALCATLYYNGMNQSIAKYIAMACFGFLFVIAFFKNKSNITKPAVFNRWILWFLLGCFVNFFYGIEATNEEIAMPLIVAFSAYYLLDIPREKLSLYMLPVCVFGAYCAIQSVLSGIGSFTVSILYDDDVAKNQIGAAFTAVAIVCLVFALEKNKKVIQISYGVLSLISLYPAIFFTCRTAQIAYVLVVAYLLYGAYGKKGLLLIPILIVIASFVGGSTLQSLLYDSIIGNRDYSDADDLTSGRVSQAVASLEYFMSHPLTGFYGSGDSIASMPRNAHIYILFRLTKWGVLGAIPYLMLYYSIVKIWISSFKQRDLLLMGALGLALVESFSEYAPPFGPGSCFILVFALIGFSMRQNSKMLK